MQDSIQYSVDDKKMIVEVFVDVIYVGMNLRLTIGVASIDDSRSLKVRHQLLFSGMERT